MSREWTPEEESAMASEPSEWEPIEVDVDPTAGIVFDLDFDRSECALLFSAIGRNDPFAFIKSAVLERAREMIAEREASDGVTAAD